MSKVYQIPECRTQPFDVILKHKVIDTVFYDRGTKVTTDEVKRSLVDHDGYDPGITVRKVRCKAHNK